MWELCCSTNSCEPFGLKYLPKIRQWRERKIANALVFLPASFLLILTILMPFIAKDAMAQSSNPSFSLGLQKKLKTLPPGVRIIARPEDGTISYIRAGNLSSILEEHQHFRAIQSSGEPVTVAIAFLNAYKDLFGIENPEEEFVLKSLDHNNLGYSQVRLHQVYLGIPVWNTEILILLNQGSHILLVQGDYIKTPLKVNVRAALSKKQALKNAAQTVKIDSQCPDCKLETVIYVPQSRQPKLAFKISVTVSFTEAWLVFVDANIGLILNKIPTTYSGSVGKLQ